MRRLFLLSSMSMFALTGCGFVAGNMLGGSMFGEGEGIFDGPDYYGIDEMGSWAGTGVVCLGSDSETLEPNQGYYEITGRVVSESADDTDMGNLVACVEPPARVLVLETASGDQVQVGFAWLSFDGWDSTPMVGVEEGQRVRVVVRQGVSEDSQAAGMALFDGDELLYAIEAGHGEGALLNDDLPNLNVGSDEVVGRTDEDCGTRVSLAQQFTSDEDALTLYEGEDASMYVDGEYFTTCNIASFGFEDGCDDVVTENSWVMFR